MIKTRQNAAIISLRKAGGGLKTNILVAYVPGFRHMRQSAERIAALSGGDIFEIRARTPYPERPRSIKREMKAEQKRNVFPALHSACPDLSGYRKIVLGFPLIAGRCPNIVRSFLRQSDLRGNTLCPYYITGQRRIGRHGPEFPVESNASRVLPCRNVDRMDQQEIQRWLAASE